MKRSYEIQISEHLNQHRQMVFLSGPRQVGKTTLCTRLDTNGEYLNWDDQDNRALLIEGPRRVAEETSLDVLGGEKKTIVFDEIHKYSRWKDFLKGFFDSYGSRSRIVVTGSSKLDVYKKGGDSLMGRYFPYRLHPFSVREIIDPHIHDQEIQTPKPLDADSFSSLFTFGGFPEPFLKSDRRFYNRWRKLRQQQLFYEDIRDFTQIQEIHQLELMAEILQHQTGQLLNYSTLSKKIRVSVDTIRRWLITLNSLFYCFSIQPWHRNIPRSLLKQPKIFLWDWSMISDIGARTENFVASHLMKAVNWWTDNGYGEYGLYFLRDKDKREVDFLVTRDQTPWFLLEVKSGKSNSINRHLSYFQNCTKAMHAFQVSFAMDYVDMDCFSRSQPTIVPAKTLLSQLV